MKKDPFIFIEHILQSIVDIEEFTKNMDEARFMESKLVQSAVFRQVEIIGEAVKNIPKEFTEKYQSVPWSEIAKTRDKVIHHYFKVDLDLTYQIIKEHIPKLKKEIEQILLDKPKN